MKDKGANFLYKINSLVCVRKQNAWMKFILCMGRHRKNVPHTFHYIEERNPIQGVLVASAFLLNHSNVLLMLLNNKQGMSSCFTNKTAISFIH